MNTKKLKIAVEQIQKACNEMNECANKFILQDSINEIKEAVNLEPEPFKEVDLTGVKFSILKEGSWVEI